MSLQIASLLITSGMWLVPSEQFQALSEHPGGQTSLAFGSYRKVMILYRRKKGMPKVTHQTG